VPSVRFLLAVAASIAVVLSAPFIRDIRDWIRSNFPGQFVTFVAAAVAIAIAAAILVALIRIRDRRGMRYGLIGAALAIGTAYAIWNAQGIPEVDAVERFHFVEYGLITVLFYRAWRPLGDGSLLILPVLAGLVVGTSEEWLQWFIPGRIGDMRDIFLNGAAIVCGLLFSLGVDPPDRVSLVLRPGSLRRIGFAAAATGLFFALFVDTVHLGVEISEAEAVRFRSRYDARALIRHGHDRLARWKADPPLQRPASRSREDQYQSEGHLHVQERNRRWAAGDVAAAWAENLILEKFYAPVLDTPSYISPAGHRWPDTQRRDALERLASAPRPSADPYESLADAAEGRHFIRTWPRPFFWSVVILCLGAVLGLAFSFDPGQEAVVASEREARA
jgi:hypothetical protein